MVNTDKKLIALKGKLSEELLKENSDNTIILSLSHEIASLDKDQIRFSIDAGIIDRLGRELVARQETAVSELVKNAYDADAQEVSLTFINSNIIGGTLNVTDDGDGMSREELINGFMRLSSTDKIHNPFSKTFDRKRAGQKGIGRFAVQRLGRKLSIITQREDSNEALLLTINWDSYHGDINLTSISNDLKIIPKTRIKGTTLIIDQLRDSWSQASIQRIYSYVTDIIQPFPLSKKPELEENSNQAKIDPGFKTTFYKVDGSETKTIADTKMMVYDHALAIIDGYVDKEGRGVYSIKSDKLGLNEPPRFIGNDPTDPSVPFDKLTEGEVTFRAYYFNYLSDFIPKMHKASIQKLAKNNGGIRLYRNGFRVLPYAEPGDDWLKLDKSVRDRVILPPHANNNFFGFVEITDSKNLFNETSSREGLVENDALIQLKNFVYRTIITGMLKVNESRGDIKLLASQQRDDEGNWERIEFKVKNIALSIEELDKELENDTGSAEAKATRRKRVKKIQQAVIELAEIQKTEHDRQIKERSMLRVLSSIGLTIAQFIHEIKYYLDNIQSDIRFLISKLQHDKITLERAVILEANFASFHTYTSYFDDVISQNVIRDLKPLDLRTVVEPFIKSIHEDASKADIKFAEPVFNQYRLFTKPMHPSEWSSILFNFYTNSKKAIKRAGVHGNICIECGETESHVYLEFSDNGDGISKENEERVFDEFFTTTSPSSFENISQINEILGTGLGLKIVKDIINSYRGNVKVVSPKEIYSTCIRIEVPKATEKDIEKYGV